MIFAKGFLFLLPWLLIVLSGGEISLSHDDDTLNAVKEMCQQMAGEKQAFITFKPCEKYCRDPSRTSMCCKICQECIKIGGGSSTGDEDDEGICSSDYSKDRRGETPGLNFITTVVLLLVGMMLGHLRKICRQQARQRLQ